MHSKKCNLSLLLQLTLLYFFVTATQGKNLPLLRNITTNDYALLHKNASTNSNSPWLMGRRDPRFFVCWRRPWICNQDYFPRIRFRCCRNRCVDVTSDPNNCGLCGIRCPFTWQCCRGICVNTNLSPFNCGRCGNRCPFPSFCIYGMCNYAEPLPPFPFPVPPRPSFPWPFPPRPFPPRPPFPWPFPPRPFPPKSEKPAPPPAI